jgi:hypothetical protein
VRYSVSLIRPDPIELRDVRVDVTLPPGADFVEALETPGYTQFLGRQGDALAWAAPGFGAEDYVDDFTFALRGAPAGDFRVRARWAGARPGEARFEGRPEVANARGQEGALTLGPQGTGDRPVPVGDSGVLVGAPAGALPAGTTVRVLRHGPDANPPTALGDVWWCAVVEVQGLPDDKGLMVLVPTRRPLPPLTEVILFAQRDGVWVELPEKGIATLDGQYVGFAHRGGLMAAGFQPGQAVQAQVSNLTEGITLSPNVLEAIQPPRRTSPPDQRQPQPQPTPRVAGAIAAPSGPVPSPTPPGGPAGNATILSASFAQQCERNAFNRAQGILQQTGNSASASATFTALLNSCRFGSDRSGQVGAPP